MKLEDIGFYTLSDYRAQHASVSSPLARCEILLTDRCNYACPYCRGMREDLRGTRAYDQVKATVDAWISEGLINVRFSGGEPTLWPGLCAIAQHCKANGVERVAVSTNGSASKKMYNRLLQAGVDDFSVSLDACCAADGDRMAGGRRGSWDHVVEMIRFLSSRSYVTVGMVFTPDNVDRAKESVLFADSLGVSDIRVVPSAQFNQALGQLETLPEDVLDRHPILRYRIENVRRGRNVRGMDPARDCGTCYLVLDDMAVAGDWHFPCIIYLREGGDPIGRVGPNMRQERAAWAAGHDSLTHPICSEMCLDVCIDFNNTAERLR